MIFVPLYKYTTWITSTFYLVIFSEGTMIFSVSSWTAQGLITPTPCFMKYNNLYVFYITN